ncbi:uncharacterized protein LOC101897040 [Musca domestica]|uniref:Uncharacterized protein LOC101897040 n=1 Tax=Musca domestica TaxID=7370 RepID=A0A1I8MZH2_MUSDO|nr:uncharacterized protein LOC101897040 [Musca domestica]
MKYEINPKYVKSIDLKLIPYRQHNAINGSAFFGRDVHDIRVVHWVTSTRSDGRIWKVYNVTLNFCDILENKYNKLIVVTEAVVRRIIEAIPQLPQHCPFKKDTEYSLTNFYLEEEIMPVFVPNMKFETAFNMMSNKEYFFKLLLTARVESKIGQRNVKQSSKNPK